MPLQKNKPLVYAFFMSAIPMNYKELPISERIQLVEDIWDSIAEETSGGLPFSPEERAVMHSRYAAHEVDPSSSIPWDQVRAALFKGQR